MNTKLLERFAQSARRQLHTQVAAKLDRVLSTDSAELRARSSTVSQLKEQIKEHGKQAVVERVAYTWFNRFCALRYMDVNRYTRIGIVSPATLSPQGETYTQPEILQEAKAGLIDADVQPFVDGQKILDLLGGRTPSPDPQGEAYRLLLVGACNSYHDTMPFLFEPIDDYSELLMPDDLLSQSAILQGMREALTPENCQDVEVIGWLYQFYISEKKDQVIGSKAKIKPADIPAATQLFTPHWIVRYLVENSLGRLWMLNRPGSRLVEHMDYYIGEPVDSSQKSVVSGQAASSPSALTTDHRPLTTAPTTAQTTDYLRLSSAEEIRLCDPAAGSGHMLTYAFDLLYAIYEEEGYAPSDIPQLILTKNLYGMEIDERAGALAAFALTMKARAKDRRFFRRGIRPRITVLRPIRVDEAELAQLPWYAELGETLTGLPIQDALAADLAASQALDNIGSLWRPQLSLAQIHDLRRIIDAGQDLFSQVLNQQMLALLDQAEVLVQKYHVVVANPPYMGSKGMNSNLTNFANENYMESKSDLFAMFLVRGFELAMRHGFNAMVTMESWMFLSSYEKLRAILLKKATLLTMVHMPYLGKGGTPMGINFGTAAAIFENHHREDYQGHFSCVRYYECDDNYVPKEFPVHNERLSTATAADFKKIPGSPIVYWASKQVLASFQQKEPLSKYIETREGLTTGSNDTFLRLWHEVRISSICFNATSNDDAMQRGQRWFSYIKGGNFRRWAGNYEYVVNWQHNGEVMRAFADPITGRIRSHNYNGDYAFRRGFTWSGISSGNFAVRYVPNGFMFDAKGPMGFALSGDNLALCQAFLNSRVTGHLLEMLAPTLDFKLGHVLNLPFDINIHLKVSSNWKENVSASKNDWNSSETSWDFTNLPLIRSDVRRTTLANTYTALRTHWREMTLEMQRLEEENNRLFIDAYGLQHELTSDVPLAEITLTCNPYYRYSGQSSVDSSQWERMRRQWPEVAGQLAQIAEEMAPEVAEAQRLGLEQRLLADTMREFISYAVGCMFGRYSLDKPGLILANQGEGVADYVEKVVSSQWSVVSGQAAVDSSQWSVVSGQAASSPSALTTDNRLLTTDNVIPMLDGDWFADDIGERFRRFLRVTFGEEHYEENLTFIEAALGRDIRGYFLREFYDDHVKCYQKRPIYWLFSSPNGSFNALIYMHRYRPDTVSVVLNDYLREFRTKLTARKHHLEGVSISAGASQRDKTQALREIDKLDKVLAELQAYEDEILYPLATRQVQIDLDDGVKVNYAKFGAALKKVSGLNS